MSQDDAVRDVISRHAVRRLDVERTLTTDAAATLTASPPLGLIVLSESRAGLAPVRDVDHRNFGREVLEEISDARNYLVWWMEQIARGAHRNGLLAGELTQAIAQTLAHDVLVFEHAQQAQALMIDWRRP